ncbi:MAG TPA: CheW domain-containing protein [Ideonella sp.]|uniref:chemotaxis protein CheW n=1 Tax=Ideonella sp. TaxID=1929293 RepID=UPI002E34BC03|nr:CheW domain-containing protein [Ideonella sp.]HEX5685727.1 CheW domain-containing protein [Ideonella sp.]
MDDLNVDLWLVCRVQTRLCAWPLSHVIETLRPLPIEPVAGAPSFVGGLAVVRGEPLPVVDVARLLGLQAAPPERFVVVVTDDRRVALAVSAVLGVRRVATGSLQALPPLLNQAESAVVAAVGLLDAQLLLFLRTARLIPDDALALVPEATS